jgi:hypothetical protein
MILNVSYKNSKIARQIDEAVGEQYTWKERLRLKGIGSSKLIITDASGAIAKLLNLDSNRNQCNIEIRPDGIIVGFRSLLESYAFVIPFYKLVLYKGDAELYSIYKDNQFIKIEAKPRDKATHNFIKKILAAKTNIVQVRIEDL